MCQCGCTDGVGNFKFKLSEGYLTFHLYGGCRDCDTPAGVMVERYSEETAKEWDIEHLPDLPIHLNGDSNIDGSICLPIIDPNQLLKETEDDPMQIELELFIEDSFNSACRNTISDFLKEHRK